MISHQKAHILSTNIQNTLSFTKNRACITIMDSITNLFIFLLPLVSLLLSSSASSSSSSSITRVEVLYSAERDDLLNLRDSLSSTLNLHSNWTGPPCHKNRSRWIGITCFNNHVVAISLSWAQITGQLRPTAFQNITYLTNLTLSNNALRGDLPTLKGLLHLQVVSLSENRFSGSIPVEYVGLQSLTTLELEDNLLNGKIPPFEQQSLSVFNVSYNFLQGKIPNSPVLERFSRDSYDHNLGLCRKPLDRQCSRTSPPSSSFIPVSPPPPSSYSSPSSSSGTKKLKLWRWILAAICAVLVIILGYLCFCKKLYHRKKSREGENTGEGPSDSKARGEGGSEGADKLKGLEFINNRMAAFSYDNLLLSPAELIGIGKVGSSYRTNLESGQVVVKRMKELAGLSTGEFVHQMRLIGMMQHENLVDMIAFYYSEDEKLIIYENVPGGSLFQLLHGEGRQHLNCAARLKLARGIARGLAYLHHSLPTTPHRVPHANLTSKNVLIVHHHHPKLTDFGFLPLLLSPHQVRKLAIATTPEFRKGTRLTHKADIYCFGLLLLEIITGKVLQAEEVEEGLTNRDWREDVMDLEMVKLREIALGCIALEPGRRPEMRELVQRIEEIREGNIGGEEIDLII